MRDYDSYLVQATYERDLQYDCVRVCTYVYVCMCLYVCDKFLCLYVQRNEINVH